MASTVLLLCLLLAAAPWGGLTQASGPVARRGPLLMRLRRLEEQFHRLQEVILSHLQSIADNYNISYNIDRRFRELAEQAEAASAVQATLGVELARLATTGRQLHQRLKRLEGTVGALRLLSHPVAAPVEAGTKLHRLKAPAWGSQLEGEPQRWVAPSTPSLQHLKARQQQQQQHRQEGGQQLPDNAGPGEAPREDAGPLQDAALGAPALPTITVVTQEQLMAPQQPGKGMYRPPAPASTSPSRRSGAILLFPNTSAERRAVLGPEPRHELRALSFCAWLATPALHLGAFLSYTSEDGSSELAVHSSAGDLPASACFIIGDGQFRKLPVMPLLDGKWHHLCLTWSSGQGQYRFYVDRRLLAAGSGFQKGYAIPAGGLLVLGQEEDQHSRDLGSTEAFVGHLAGFVLWRRALLPGEVASMATGRGLPRDPVLTLANASLQGGVQRVPCSCLQHCL